MAYVAPDPNAYLNDPNYQSGSQTLDSSLGADIGSTEVSYNTRRQDTINSYQSALDIANENIRQAGIGIRGQYAGRNLYNASGEVSGIGQGYGTNVLNPLVQTLTRTGTERASALGNLEAQRTADITGLRSNYATKKFDLGQSILTGIRNAARQQYEDTRTEGETNYNRGRDTLADTRYTNETTYNRQQDAQSAIKQQQSAGRKLLYQKDLAGAVAKYGKDAIIQIGNHKYLKSADELEAMKPKTTTRSTGGGRTTTSTTATSPYSSYSASKDSVGGMNFTAYNKTTKKNEPISAVAYANYKGLKLDDVIAGSADPNDQALVRDIQTARSRGASEDEILQAIQASGNYNHLFS
jgi:predicted DNA-binding protein (UPF0251 family)